MPHRDRRAFIRCNLDIAAVPGCPGLKLYVARPDSGLSRLAGAAAPYWAWPWPGGLALARYLIDAPQTVAGCRVLDLGAGSGLVGIVAMQQGAAEVTAADTDRNARAAMRENAALNRVRLRTLAGDMLDGPVPDVDVILAGDVFYEQALAARVLEFLRRAHGQGTRIVLGDIGRPGFSPDGLTLVARHAVADVGDTPTTPLHEGGVYVMSDPDSVGGNRLD